VTFLIVLRVRNLMLEKFLLMIGWIIRPDEVCYAIEKLTMNKACGLDKITAEYLKHACGRIPVLLAMFYWFDNAWHTS
jgi:hypothetical protein